MPTAGDEGYERLIRCPYDKSHEIRKGRMQFHLEKCRKNFPSSQLTDCPFNKAHQIPKQELQYHIEEECPNRIIWERFTHESDSVDCPVRDLVPVNAASVPNGGESWDSFESTTSVLNNIRAEAENRPVLRSCQVASKATRKAFRKAERERFENVTQTQLSQPEYAASTSSVSSHNPLPRPKVTPNIPVFKQDPQKALATIAKTKTTVAAENLNMNSSQASGSVVPSETSSVISEYASSVSSNQMPFSYAAASQGRASRPLSVASNQTTDTSVMTALTSQHGRMPRVNGAMSNSSFATASQGLVTPRPQSSMSDYSMAESMMSAMSLSSARRSPGQRPTTAMNIAASAAAYIAPDADQEGFSQIPIPGLGRGRRAKAKN